MWGWRSSITPVGLPRLPVRSVSDASSPITRRWWLAPASDPVEASARRRSMPWPASNTIPLVRLPEEGARQCRTSHNAARLEDGTHAGSPVLSPDGRLFALGTRTLGDLIAPAGAEI